METDTVIFDMVGKCSNSLNSKVLISIKKGKQKSIDRSNQFCKEMQLNEIKFEKD